MSEIYQHIVSPPEQPAQADKRKVSRISDQQLAFVQQAYAAGASEKLDERQRIFMAHAVTKPQLTLRELAPFTGVSLQRTHKLLKTGFQTLWEASPLELQQQYPLDILLRHKLTGIPRTFSPEHKAKISVAKKGKSFSPEHKAKIGEALRGKTRRPFSPETRAKMSEAKKGKSASEAQLAHIKHLAELRKGKKLKPHSPETRAKMSEEQLTRLKRAEQAEDYGKLMENWYYPSEEIIFDATSPRE